MASPYAVAFQGIDDLSITFASALVQGTDEEKPVNVSANGTVALAADGEQFIGIVTGIDESDKAATVKISGFQELTYTGADPSLGIGTLVADGSGTVKGAADAAGKRLYQVVSLDTAAKTVIIWL